MITHAAVTVTNPSGLHARPAAELARLAGSLPSEVRLLLDGRTVDAASVLSVMAAGVRAGQEVVVEVEGDEAEADLATVVAAIRSGLGELVV
jgi:phosphotransferase system HPr (HPr) family protein